MADSDVNIAYATSDLDQDQLLYDNLSSDYPIYRGHPDNVIARIISQILISQTYPNFTFELQPITHLQRPFIYNHIDFAD